MTFAVILTPPWLLTWNDEETERAMYEMLIDCLTAAGYEHYEISNFARPGYRSRHNSSYWNDTPYIGLGAAAHSYDGHCRSWNVAETALISESWTSVTVSTVSPRRSGLLMTACSKSLITTSALLVAVFLSAIW